MTLLADVRTAGGDRPSGIRIVDGRIAAIEERAATTGDVIDGEGTLVLPALVEPHLHLDKAHLDGVRPNPTGTLADAIAITAQLKSTFDRADLLERSRRVLESAILHGTTLARVHADVDPSIGTMSVEVMLELREAYRGTIDLQVVAFPQEGIIGRPGTLELLHEAVALGADVIGGCSYSEPTYDDCLRHIALVLDIAERHGIPADFHADFADDDTDPRFGLIDAIATGTSARGMAGRVTAGHVTSLAGLSRERRRPLIDHVAAAGVSVIALPATDLHLGGRADTSRVRRGIAPVAELAAAGVRVGLSSNNVRNAFTPYGNADQFQTALLLAQTSHLSTEAELEMVLHMASTGAAEILGVPDHRVEVGGRADLVLVAADRPALALLDQSPRRLVLKAGQVVAETLVTTRRHRVPAVAPPTPR